MYVCMYVCMHVCMYVCMYVYMYVCMYVIYFCFFFCCRFLLSCGGEFENKYNFRLEEVCKLLISRGTFSHIHTRGMRVA